MGEYVISKDGQNYLPQDRRKRTGNSGRKRIRSNGI